MLVVPQAYVHGSRREQVAFWYRDATGTRYAVTPPRSRCAEYPANRRRAVALRHLSPGRTNVRRMKQPMICGRGLAAFHGMLSCLRTPAYTARAGAEYFYSVPGDRLILVAPGVVPATFRVEFLRAEATFLRGSPEYRKR